MTVGRLGSITRLAQPDDVSGLYVNGYRDLRVGSRLVACDAEQMDRDILLHVLGARLVEQSEQRRCCWSLRSCERDTCLLLDVGDNVRFGEHSRQVGGREFHALGGGFLRFALAGEDEVDGLLQALGDAARFRRFLLALRLAWR